MTMAWEKAVAAAVLTSLAYLIRKTLVHRSKINALRKQGIPMPEGWSWFAGHLLTLPKYVDRLPPDANVNLAMQDLAREFADTEIFLMDFWPVYPPLLMVYDPDTAVQISTKYNLPKTDMHLQFMTPITGGPSLVSMGDQEWKTWRSLFNPGFSSTAMMDSVPHIVNSVQVFCDKLEASGKGLISLDSLTTRLTMDVIIKLTLGADLDYQRSENALATALGYITRWHSFWDPRILLLPFRWFVQKYYGRVMEQYIRKELNKRFREIKEGTFSNDDLGQSKGTKSVVTLAIEAYIKENENSNLLHQPDIEENFSQYVVYQIRLFLFAGNDTTSSTIVYVYHLLSQRPEALSTLRKEHADVFGTDTSRAADLLREKPSLLNKCHFTLAVIKETLRLYPPAATMRAGRPGVAVSDRHGNNYPMDYVGATVLHPAVHSNPRIWPHPQKFIPERFMVEAGHELYPNPGAFRPFEQGPRNCIGQTLVYNEIRTVMAMTARRFDIKPAYEEWDEMERRERGYISGLRVGIWGEPVKDVHGDRAYQTEKAGTHTADGYPCRVSVCSDRNTEKVFR